MPTQTLWAELIGGSLLESPVAVSVGSSGAIAATGFTNSLSGFDGQSSNGGEQNIFVTLFDPFGTKKWTRFIGSSAVEYAKSVAVSETNDVYLVGNRSQNGFLAKISESGTVSWSSSLNLDGLSSLNSVVIGQDGFLYVVGSVLESANSTSNNIILAKYSSSGSQVWLKTIGLPGARDAGESVAVDNNGNIYFTGSTTGNLNGIINNSAGSDAFVAKYDSNGNMTWSLLAGEAIRAAGRMLAVGADGSIYCGGFTLIGPSEQLFLARFAPDGSQVWKKYYPLTSSIETSRLVSAPTGGIYFVDGTRVVKLNELGIEEWSSIIDYATSVNSITIGSDGRGIIAGETRSGIFNSETNNGSADAFVGKIVLPNLVLASTGIQENSSAGAVIGTLSTFDPDAGSTLSYELIAGDGANDADNVLVDIVGNEVRVKSGASIDFETNPILNLNIRVTDNTIHSLALTKAVTALVLNINELPSGFTFFPTKTVGAVQFGSTQLGYALQNGVASPLSITNAGAVVAPVAGWSAFAAASTVSGYDLYWKNTNGIYAKWFLNSSAALTTSAVISTAAFLQDETNLGVDLDGDGSTGLTFTPGTPTLGSVTLGATQLGYAFKNGNASPIQISFSGQFASTSNPGAGWNAFAAAALGSGFELFWKNSNSGQFVRWILDSNGVLSSGALLSTSELLLAETRLNSDLNADGSTGLTFSPSPSTLGTVTLGSTQLGYAIQNGNASPIQISFSGQFASTSNPGAGWNAFAAAALDSGFEVFWKNSATGQYVRWALDATGNLSSGALLSTSELLLAETRLNTDLNGDSSTGLSFSPGALPIGSVTLGSTQLGYAIQNGNASPIQISFSGQFASTSNPGAGWNAIAAAALGSGFELFWKNSNSGQFVRWILDSNGVLSSGALLSTSELLLAETRLDADLNDDGSIYTVNPRLIETAGIIKLSSDNQGTYNVQSTLPIQLSNENLASPKEQLGDGLIRQRYRDIGYGFEAQPGDTLSVIYTGKLVDGTTFDSNAAAGRPQFDFTLGTGSVIQGFDIGLRGASLGDIYLLEIPSSLGYGSRATGSIPPNSTLIFDVEIRGISRGTTQLTFPKAIGNIVDKFPLKKDNMPVNSDTLGIEWKILAAERINENNQVLWKNLSTNKLLTWNMDSGWNWSGSGGLIEPLSGAGKQLESQFGVDVNGDDSILAYKPGTISADTITGTSSNEFFAPLGVSGTGVDRIILGGGSNQIQLQASSFSNLYADIKESDYLIVEDFNLLTDKLLLAGNKAYEFFPASLGTVTGTAIYEDNDGDKIYNNNDELLVWLKGVTAMSANSLLLG